MPGMDSIVFVKLKTARNAFISGLLMLAPVGVTIFVINFLISTLGRPTSRLFFFFIDDSTLEQYPILNVLIVIASAFIVVILITLFGWFSSFIIGRFFMSWMERMMASVPFVRSVYMTVKQIVDTFTKSNKAVFRKTVLVEYPHKGVYAIGFLTGDAKGEIQERTKAFLLNVFVPTTPNPTSGFLLLVPQDEIIMLDMSVSDGMKAIISGGALMPQPRAQAAPSASDNGVDGVPPEGAN
jgi:uncharacterized membrane protein